MKNILTLFLLCILGGKAYGQFTTPINFSKFLPIDNVSGTFQDKEGYLWIIVSREGLFRFDGVAVQQYSTDAKNPDYRLPWNELSPPNICEHNGYMWVLFSNGSISIIKDGKVISSYFGDKNYRYEWIHGTDPLIMVKQRHNAIGEYSLWEVKKSVDTSRAIIELKDSIYLEQIYFEQGDSLRTRFMSTYLKNVVIKSYVEPKTQRFVRAEFIDLNTGKVNQIEALNSFINEKNVHIYNAISDSSNFIQVLSGSMPKLYCLKKNELKRIELDLEEGYEYKSVHYYPTNLDSYTPIYYNMTLNPAYSNAFICNEKGCEKMRIATDLVGSHLLAHSIEIGSYWRSSEKGLDKIDSWILGFKGSLCNSMPSNVWIVHEDKFQKIWFAAYSRANSMASWSFDSHYVTPAMTELRKNTFYHGAILDQDSFMLLPLNQGILRYNGKNNYKKILNELVGFYLYKSPYTKDIALGTYRDGVYIFRDKKKDITDIRNWDNIPESDLGTTNVLTILQDKYGRWWGGRSRSGIFCYIEDSTGNRDKDIAYKFIIENGDDGIGLMSSTQDSFHNLWFGTSQGLYFYDIHKKGYRTPDTSDFEPILEAYFANRTINSIYNYKDSLLFIGDNKGGIGVLDLQAFYESPRRYRFQFFDLRKRYGIKEVFQNSFFVDSRDGLWLSSADLVLRLDIPKIPFYNDKINLEWDNISHYNNDIWKKHSSTNELIKLDANQRNLVFYGQYFSKRLELYDGFVFKVEKEGILQLSKQGESRNRKPKLEYTFPSYGSYTVIVEVRERNHTLAKKKLQIYIPPYWGESTRHKVILAILFLVIFVLIYVIRQRNKLFLAEEKAQKAQKELLLAEEKKKNAQKELIIAEEKEKNAQKELLLHELQTENKEFIIQALINSTNSHFIKNSLQAVQNQLYLEKKELGIDLISKLANIIDTFFEISRKKMLAHPLTEELKLIENLVFIQKIRLRNKLKKYIPPSASLVEKYGNLLVPLGSLYVHVENAIKHGIEGRKSGWDGLIEVSIEGDCPDENYLTFMIDDNGVGVDNFNSEGTSKQGLRNLDQIFKKCNKLNPYKLSYRFVVSNKLKKEGVYTRVIVEIPKNYDYELKRDKLFNN